MKKILALVLALVMVLALVPAAFAANASLKITAKDEKYRLDAVADLQAFLSAEYGGVTGTDKKKYDNTAVTPAIEIALPFESIADNNSTSIWGASYLSVGVTLSTIGGNDATDASYFRHTPGGADAPGKEDDFEVYVNNEEKTDDVTINAEGTKISFTISPKPSQNVTYNYSVKITRTVMIGSAKVDVYEVINFKVTFTDTTKNEYDLKFKSCDDDDAILKDGIWYVDTPSSTLVLSDVPVSFTFVVTKNDGSLFTETSYYGLSFSDDYFINKWDKANSTDNAWVDGNYNPPKVTSKSKIKVDFAQAYGYTGETAAARTRLKLNADETYKVYTVVETESGMWKGTLKMKFRTNVRRTDPKGIRFAKSEYTIGVNEVFKPSYTSVATVYHDLADYVTLTQTDYSDKAVIDIESGNKIIGLKEGTVYLRAVYNDYDYNGVATADEKGFLTIYPKVTYTDTCKVIVSGVYQVVPDENYVVSTSGGTLNIRSGAGTKYSKVGTLKNGDVVKVTEVKDGWAKIIKDNYTNAWVSTQYLVKQSAAGSTTSVGSKTVIARTLNVRAGAGTSYAIVGKLSRNAKVEVVEIVSGGSWAKINYNGNTAYVHTSYIK